jgi:type IV secretion system protein VirB6
MNRLLQIISLLITGLALSGCGPDSCYDADDFGFSKAIISSRYTPDQITSFQKGKEVATWVDTGFTVSGRPLTMVVKTWEYGVEQNTSSDVSAWCGWFGTADNFYTLSEVCKRFQECKFLDNKMCTNTPDAQITNAPCIFKNGVGLYAAIATPGTDPNATYASQYSPDALTMHLGEPTSGYSLFDVGADGSIRKAGGIVYQYNNDSGLKMQYVGAKLYMKILDKYYDDNAGQYRVMIKSGVNDPGSGDPIAFITALVKDNLFGTSENDYGIIRNTYLGIVGNPGYQLAVRAALILYITFTVLSFLTGNIQLTHTELITRVIKVAIVSALLSSTYAWSFFNDYLFVFFVGGVEQLIQLIQTASAGGPGSSSLIGLMIAPQTMAKLFSLLFMDWLGFIYIFLFLVALCFIFMLSFRAAIIYLSALIAIGMIIIMAPIFICFMLFGFTQSLFENWLKQLISYALQPIILFTGLAFISMILRTEIYSSLGFRVCKHDFPNLGPISMLLGDNPLNADPSLNNSIFYWWFPKPMKGQDFTRTQAVIPVPYDHFAADGSFCEAYGCMENRFIELPFLDPVADASRIRRFFNGSYVQLDGLLLIFAMVYLLSKFNEVAVATAKFLTGTSGSLASAQSSGLQAYKQMSGKIESVLGRPFEAVQHKARDAGGGLMHKLEQEYESRMERKLGKEALDDKKANQAVLDEVKRNYGMDHKELKANAEKDYEQALKASLKILKGDMSDQDISMNIQNLSNKNYKSFKDEYAKILTQGKISSYNELSKEKKDKVDEALANPKMRELSNDARFAQDFKKAYFEAHQDMSGRGIGMLGKRSSLIRSFEEMDHQVDEHRKHEEVKRQTLGERLYAGYGNLATGGSWHDYVYSDPRLRTRDETLKDQQKEFERQKLKQEINRATVGAKEDVLRPEYLARLEAEKKNADYAYYKDLSSRKLKDDVYAKLTSPEDPVLMGEKFMRKQATDSQMRSMVDRAAAVRNQMLEEDRYIRREDHYEVKYEKAGQDLTKAHNELKTLLKKDDIKIAEVQSLLERHGDSKEAKKAIEAYQKAAKEFETNQKILQEIDNRKANIKQEVDNYVNDINKYRKAAGMEEYRPKVDAEEPRKVKTIDQHLRGNNS